MAVTNEPLPGAQAPESPPTTQNPDSVVQSPPASNTMNPEAPRPTVGMNQEAAPVVPAELMENVPQERRPLVKKIFYKLRDTGSFLIHTPGNVLGKVGSFTKDHKFDIVDLGVGGAAGAGLIVSGAGAVGVTGAVAGILAYRRFIEPKFYSRRDQKIIQTYTGQELVDKRAENLSRHQAIQRAAAFWTLGIVGGSLIAANPEVVRRALTTAVGAAGAGLGMAGEAAKTVAGGAVDLAGQAGAKVAEEGPQFVGDRFSDLGTGVRAVGDNITGPAANKALEGLGNAAQTAGNIKDNAISGLGELKDNLVPAADNAKDWTGDRLGELGGVKDNALNALGNTKDTVVIPAAKDAANALGGMKDTALKEGTQFVGDRFSDLGSGVRYVGDNITGPAANNAVEGITNAAGQGVDFVGDRLGDAAGAVGQGIKDNAGALAVGAAAGLGVGGPVGSKIRTEIIQNELAKSVGIGTPGILGRIFGRFGGKKQQ